jgi:Uma2 family endonuclease
VIPAVLFVVLGVMSVLERIHAASAPPKVTRIGPMTMEEYLRREHESELKHDYHKGYMMEYSELIRSGTDLLCPDKIRFNLAQMLRLRLKHRELQVFGSGQRLTLLGGSSVVYPDASVFRGEPACFDGYKELLTNPSAIFEVVSSATEAYDRGAKFGAYREIPALELYVLISQSHPLVETYERHPDGLHWLYTAYNSVAGAAKLDALGIEIPFCELYSDVQFPLQNPASDVAPLEAEPAPVSIP